LDLGLCERKNALRLIENLLQTMEGLPKYRGHLYNWYDIRTLTPLRPEYVSTVDSGNLVGCLLALSAGLAEMARAVWPRGPKSLPTRRTWPSSTTGAAADEDRRRRRKRRGSECWYDLLESEARITSYIAVARGEADRRHWRRLGRILAERRGPAGWPPGRAPCSNTSCPAFSCLRTGTRYCTKA
jgi:cyclic beta-1,2-glucan synthetase